MGRSFLMVRWWPLAALCLLATFLAGCASYSLGPTNGVVAGSKSIRIEPFQNLTFEPRLVDYVANSLRKQVQQDGTYRLSTSGPADIIVSGQIKKFERNGVSFEPNDVLTVRDFQVTLTAQVKAIDQSTGRVLLDKEIWGRTTLRAGRDLTSAERQAGPLLAEDLARNVTSLLVDGTW